MTQNKTVNIIANTFAMQSTQIPQDHAKRHPGAPIKAKPTESPKNKQQSITAYQTRLGATTASKIAIFAAAIDIAMALTDRLMVDERALSFIITVRIFSAIYLLGCAYACMTIAHHESAPWAKTTYSIVYAVSTFVPPTVIALIIPYTGGYDSPHHLAITLSAIILAGIPCFSTPALFVMWASHTLSFPLPLLITDPAGANQAFYTTTFLHLATITALVIYRYQSDSELTKRLGLEYETAEYQKRLNTQTEMLHSQVIEQTKQIEEQYYWLETLFHVTTDGLILTCGNGIIIDVNEAACTMHAYGKEALVGTSIDLLIAHNEKPRYRELIEMVVHGKPQTYEMHHYTKNGNSILCEVSAVPFEANGKKYVQYSCRDITDKTHLQKTIAQQERLESIAIAAGGIAHDFKNTLQATQTFVELTKQRPDWETLDNIAPAIDETIAKAKDTIDRLLELNKPRPKAFAPYNINEIVKKAHTVTKYYLKQAHVKVSLNLGDKIPHSLGNHSDLEDAMINLIINAKDAMPAGGTIKVTTALINIMPYHQRPHQYPELKEGPYIIISVQDTGTGIPEDILGKIYNPYFTTKPRSSAPGSGTGLGLFNVYTTVRDHSGTIKIETAIGQGTTFTILMPIQNLQQPKKDTNSTATKKQDQSYPA